MGSIARHSTTKARRKEQVLKRKNFLPALLVTILLWGGLAGLVYFVDPDTIFAVPLFFVLSFVSLIFTFSLLFGNSRRGFVTSTSLSLLLALMYLGVGNILNLLLIVAIAVSIELYFSLK